MIHYAIGQHNISFLILPNIVLKFTSICLFLVYIVYFGLCVYGSDPPGLHFKLFSAFLYDSEVVSEYFSSSTVHIHFETKEKLFAYLAWTHARNKQTKNVEICHRFSH